MQLQFNDYLNLSKIYYSPKNKEMRLFEENRTTAFLLEIIDKDKTQYQNLNYQEFQARLKKEARINNISIKGNYPDWITGSNQPDWINLFTFANTSTKSIVVMYLCLIYLNKSLKFPLDSKELNNLTEIQQNHILSIQ